MKLVIDRFEGEFAVVEIENGELINIPKILVGDAKEGDILEIIKHKQETKIREEYIENLANKLFEN